MRADVPADKGHLFYGRDNQPDAGRCLRDEPQFSPRRLVQLIANIGPTLTPTMKRYQSWWAWRELLPKAHLNYRKPPPG